MLYVGMVPEVPRRVIVPTGWKSSVTQRTLPSGRFTSLTWTDRRLKPPQPLKRVSSAVAWPLGVLPLNAGPLRDSFSVPPVWQPDGVGGGGSVTVSENVPVALAPAESVTVTVNVEVPFTLGEPSRSPGGRERDRDAAARPGGEREARAAVAHLGEVERVSHGRTVDEQARVPRVRDGERL